MVEHCDRSKLGGEIYYNHSTKEAVAYPGPVVNPKHTRSYILSANVSKVQIN